MLSRSITDTTVTTRPTRATTCGSPSGWSSRRRPGRSGPSPPETVTAEGEIVHEGQVVGLVEGPGRQVEVRSFCTGFLMGMLVEPGQRVRSGQPVAWLRVLGDDA